MRVFTGVGPHASTEPPKPLIPLLPRRWQSLGEVISQLESECAKLGVQVDEKLRGLLQHSTETASLLKLLFRPEPVPLSLEDEAEEDEAEEDEAEEVRRPAVKPGATLSFC